METTAWGSSVERYCENVGVSWEFQGYNDQRVDGHPMLEKGMWEEVVKLLIIAL